MVPDIISVKKEENICPIISNLYSIAKCIFPKLNILTYTINVENKKDELTGLISLTQKLNIPYFETINAYHQAKEKEELYYQNLYLQFKEDIALIEKPILVASNFYTIEQVKEKLLNFNYHFLYSDYIDYRYNNINDLKISSSLDNTFLKEILKAIENNLSTISGLILIEEPNCFLTSISYELVKKKLTSLPILTTSLYSENFIEKVTSFVSKINEKEDIK